MRWLARLWRRIRLWDERRELSSIRERVALMEPLHRHHALPEKRRRRRLVDAARRRNR